MVEDSEADQQYHLELSAGDVAETVLLPGNPGRVDDIVTLWEQSHERGHNREFRTATGTFEGTPISVTSTGIGSPSAAIALEELARVGADTFIRVGSTGSIREDVAVGDLVITTGAIRQEGTSSEYVREDYPATADYEVVNALVAAAQRLGYEYHLGTTLSTDSFYAGQARPGFEGFESPLNEGLIENLREANVTNIEMEASAILTLANVYGLRAGAICTVYANRITGEFREASDQRAAEVACLATKILEAMDQAKAEAGVEHFHPGLDIE